MVVIMGMDLLRRIMAEDWELSDHERLSKASTLGNLSGKQPYFPGRSMLIIELPRNLLNACIDSPAGGRSRFAKQITIK